MDFVKAEGGRELLIDLGKEQADNFQIENDRFDVNSRVSKGFNANEGILKYILVCVKTQWPFASTNHALPVREIKKKKTCLPETGSLYVLEKLGVFAFLHDKNIKIQIYNLMIFVVGV